MLLTRITESQLAIPALRCAYQRENGIISTSELIDELAEIFQPQGEDGEILKGRNDTKFSQKVRNLISHRDVQGSIFSRGYAKYLPNEEAIEITRTGRKFVDQLPE